MGVLKDKIIKNHNKTGETPPLYSVMNNELISGMFNSTDDFLIIKLSFHDCNNQSTISR